MKSNRDPEKKAKGAVLPGSAHGKIEEKRRKLMLAGGGQKENRGCGTVVINDPSAPRDETKS